jgi:hypothetical protein
MTVKEHLLLKELGNANAFPQAKEDLNVDSEYGLTKREYFAAMAMQGLLANSLKSATLYIESNAKFAVQAADALIAELNK